MSSFKNIIEKLENKENPKVSEEEQNDDHLYDTVLEGSLHYLFGSLETYYQLYGRVPPKPDDVIVLLKGVPKNLKTEEEWKVYLKENKNDFNEFIYWFFFEKERY